MNIQNQILQRILSFLLICIFAFGTTPPVYLHNLFADHVDLKIEHHHKRTNEVAKAGMYCHTDNYVAERKFVFTLTPVKLQVFTAFKTAFVTFISDFYSQHHFFTELRGPPVKA